MAFLPRFQLTLRFQNIVVSSPKSDLTRFSIIATALQNRGKITSAYAHKDPTVVQKNRKAKLKQAKIVDDAFTRSGVNKSRQTLTKRSVLISNLGQIVDPYIPIAKKNFILTPKGLKQRWQAFKSFMKSTYCVAVLKRKARPFNISDFKLQAEKIYIAANEALSSQDKNRLHELTTETAFHELRSAFKNKLVKWEYLGAASKPRITNVRVVPLDDKTNTFAQVTVKLQLKQILTVYDEYNRLITGNENRFKQPTEYVVFERHLAKPNSPWRICGKIVPEASYVNRSTSNSDQSNMAVATTS